MSQRSTRKKNPLRGLAVAGTPAAPQSSQHANNSQKHNDVSVKKKSTGNKNTSETNVPKNTKTKASSHLIPLKTPDVLNKGQIKENITPPPRVTNASPQNSSFTKHKVLPNITQKESAKESTKQQTGNSSNSSSVVTNSSKKMNAEYVNIPRLDKETRLLMAGQLDNLPTDKLNTVRIFLSSTFADMKLERNYLAKEAYPKLKTYCQGLELDFQVIDMRWGVTNRDSNDHSAPQICFNEINSCQRVSLGPNFVALLGDRYGYRDFPVNIPEQEFLYLKRAAMFNKLENLHFYDEWFQLDKNSVPPVYVLQTVSSKLAHFLDDNPANSALREEHTTEWRKICGQIQNLIQSSAKLAHTAKQLNDKRFEEYFTSITTKEILRGIINNPERNDQCLCYIRKFDNADMSHSASGKWIDMTANQDGTTEIDQEAQDLLLDLKKKVIPSCLSSSNIKQYTAKIMPDATFDMKSNEAYLKQLSEDFVLDVSRLVDKAYKEQNQLNLGTFHSTYREALHHSKFSQAKCRSFCGQTEFLSKVKQTLLKQPLSTTRCPVVITAESGCGKTCLVAKVGQMMSEWVGPNIVKVQRYLGTSKNSTDLAPMLKSICEQIHAVYEIAMPDLSQLMVKDLSDHLKVILTKVSLVKKRPLLIILDALDQLSDTDNAFSLSWLPTSCPPNVFIIMSCLSTEKYNILKTLKGLILEPPNILTVPELSEDTIVDIMDSYLKHSQRTLTDFQRSCLMSAFQNCRQPLYMKLLLDDAKTWTSYKSDGIQLAPNTASAIGYFFERLKMRFTPNLVKYALGYLTMASLSEIELEDLLSMKDEVMNEIFVYHDPPVDGVVHIPSSIWPRLRNHIEEYIAERVSDGRITLSWFHRMFLQVALISIVTDRKGKMIRDIEIASYEIHNDITNMYLAESGVFQDILLTHRNKKIPNANRMVTAQPTVFTNKRKLSMLPFHLYQSGPFNLVADKLKENIVCNLDYLVAKLKSSTTANLASLQNQLRNFLSQNSDREIEIMQDFLNMCHNQGVTWDNAPCFVAEILGRLPQLSKLNPFIKKLVERAILFIASYKDPLFVPVYPCLPTPGSLLRKTINGPAEIIKMGQGQVALLVMNCESNTRLGCGAWWMLTNEQCRSFERKLDFYQTNCFVSHDIKYVARASKERLAVWDVMSGKISQDVALVAKLEPSQVVCHNLTLYAVGYPLGTVKIMSGSKTSEIQAHKSSITKLDISPNGKVIVSASDDERKLCVIAVAMFQVMASVKLPGCCRKLAFTEDSQFVIAACEHHHLVQIDLATGKEVAVLNDAQVNGSDKVLRDFVISKSGQYYLTTGGYTLNVWTSNTQKLRSQITAENANGGLNLVALDSSEHFAFVSNVTSGDVDVWHIPTGQRIHSISAHSSDVSSVRVQTSTNTLYTTTSLGCCKVWNTGPVLLEARKAHLSHLKEPKLKKFETALLSGDNSVLKKDVDVLAAVGMVPYHTGLALIGEYNNESVQEANNCSSMTEAKEEQASMHPDVNRPVSNVLLASLTKSLVITVPGKPPAVYNQDTGTLLRQFTISIPCSKVRSVCFGLNEKVLLGVVQDSNNDTFLQAWDFKTGAELRMKTLLPVQIIGMTKTKDKAFTCFINGDDLSFSVIHLQMELEVCNQFSIPLAEIGTKCIHWLQVSHDQKYCILGCSSAENETETNYIVIDLGNTIGNIQNEETVSLGIGHFLLHTLVTSPVHVILADNTVLSATNEGDIIHWNLTTCKMLNPLFVADVEEESTNSKLKTYKYTPAHVGAIHQLSPSIDGTLLVAASADRRLSLWTGKLQFLHYLEGHMNDVLSAVISKDNRYITSGSKDQTIRLWDIASRSCLCMFTAYTDVYDLHLASDNRRLVARGDVHEQKLFLLKLLNVRYC